MGAASGRAARCATVSILDAANLAFLDHVALISNPGNSGIIESKRGKNGGTSAHWQIGLAYAKYLSPEFLWEIAENLHRAELSVQERADHIAEWVRLTEEKLKEQPAQVAPHRKAGQQPGGINAAVRELGIERTEAQRAVKIAGIKPEAKAAAVPGVRAGWLLAHRHAATADLGAQFARGPRLAGSSNGLLRPVKKFVSIFATGDFLVVPKGQNLVSTRGFKCPANRGREHAKTEERNQPAFQPSPNWRTHSRPFTADTAKKTGHSERSVQRDATRALKIDPDVLADMATGGQERPASPSKTEISASARSQASASRLAIIVCKPASVSSRPFRTRMRASSKLTPEQRRSDR
jgi:hypothetical protein